MSQLQNPMWLKVTKTYSDFSDPGFTKGVSAFTIPKKAIVHNAMMVPTTAFSGGAIATYTISLGMYTLTDISAAQSVLTIPTSSLVASSFIASPISSTKGLTATAISGVGALDQATQGSVDIYVLVSNL